MKGNMESRSPEDTRSRVRPSPACTAHTAPLPDSVLLGDRACVLFLVVCFTCSILIPYRSWAQLCLTHLESPMMFSTCVSDILVSEKLSNFNSYEVEKSLKITMMTK